MATTVNNGTPAPKELSTPTSMTDTGAQNVIAAMAGLTADAFALYVKTKNFHWHVSGPHFRDYHKLFDEQAEQIFAMIDVLAERARKVGGMTIHSVGQIAKLTRIKDDDETAVSPDEMLRRLKEDNLAFDMELRLAHDVADTANDKATTSILEIFLDETQRRIWFLFEAAQ